MATDGKYGSSANGAWPKSNNKADKPMTEQDYQNLYDRVAALRETVTGRLTGDLIQNPQLADALVKQIDDMLAAVVDQDTKTAPPPDKGLAQLIGLGPEAANEFGKTRIPQGVEPYDE